ncbi:MAG: Spy/CpxP family protein refolding chaperone [Salinarimonas sp.]
MTDQPENNTPASSTTPATKPAKSRAWRYAVIGGVAIAAIAGVNVAVSGSASHGWGKDSRMHSMMGDRMAGMGLDFAEWRVTRALTEAGTGDETSKEVAAIMREAADDILPVMMEMRGTRDEAIRILTAPEIDREAAEELRRTRIENIDQASQRALAGLLDAAEKLTVAEREKLIDNLAEARHRRRW